MCRRRMNIGTFRSFPLKPSRRLSRFGDAKLQTRAMARCRINVDALSMDPGGGRFPVAQKPQALRGGPGLFFFVHSKYVEWSFARSSGWQVGASCAIAWKAPLPTSTASRFKDFRSFGHLFAGGGWGLELQVARRSSEISCFADWEMTSNYTAFFLVLLRT